MSPRATDAEHIDEGAVIVVDGRAIPLRAGQSVGAVLVSAGIRAWRTTRKNGRPRGLFCGIGICYDCLLTIDGRPNQRACLTAARPGMRVSTVPVETKEALDG